VLVYVPAYVFCGTNTPIVGVSVNNPIPVLAAELKILTAVGGPEPAGTATGYVTALVGAVFVPAPFDTATPVRLDALAASVWVPAVNCVEVIVSFQPAPVPRVSCVVNAAVYVGVESPRSRFAENDGVADVLMLSVLPVIVPVAVADAAKLAAGATRIATTAAITPRTKVLELIMQPSLASAPPERGAR
jgi:hypothetical protein